MKVADKISNLGPSAPQVTVLNNISHIISCSVVNSDEVETRGFGENLGICKASRSHSSDTWKGGLLLNVANKI